MGNVNIPSYNALLPKERRIRSIQELYEAVKEIQAGGRGGTDPTIVTRIEALEALVSEGDNPTLAIDKINEIIAFLSGYSNTDTLSGLLTQLSNDISGKQDALTFNTAPSSSNKVATMADVPSVPNNLVCFSNDSGEGIVPEDGIKAETKTAGATLSINPDVVTVINGVVGTSAITLQVPNDNLAHVWDILMTTDSSVAITFAMSNSATILYPNGFSIGASKAVEVSVIGVGTKYYLRYGEFA